MKEAALESAEGVVLRVGVVFAGVGLVKESDIYHGVDPIGVDPTWGVADGCCLCWMSCCCDCILWRTSSKLFCFSLISDTAYISALIFCSMVTARSLIASITLTW